MRDDRHNACPFGWSVPRVGRKPGQVRDEVRAMVDRARRTWEVHFPAAAGYQVEVESPAGRGHGVQLSVQRGDFRAAVAIERGLAPSRRNPTGRLQVRMFGRAESSCVERTHAQADAFVGAGRQLGGVAGLVAALVLPAVPVAGMVVLGVMFWIVLALAATIVGGAIGGALGERMGELLKVRAARGALCDPHLQHDLRRWKALSRQLAKQRSTLAEGVVAGQPFRSLRGC